MRRKCVRYGHRYRLTFPGSPLEMCVRWGCESFQVSAVVPEGEFRENLSAQVNKALKHGRRLRWQ